MPSSNRSVSPSARERTDTSLRDVYSGNPDAGRPGDAVKRKRDGSIERRASLTPHPYIAPGAPLLPLGGAGEAERVGAREDAHVASAREDAQEDEGEFDSSVESDDGQESRPGDEDYEDLQGMMAATEVLRELREGDARLGELTLPETQPALGRGAEGQGGQPHDHGAPSGQRPADVQGHRLHQGTQPPATPVDQEHRTPATEATEGGKSQFNTAHSLSGYEVVPESRTSGHKEEVHDPRSSSGAPRMAAGSVGEPVFQSSRKISPPRKFSKLSVLSSIRIARNLACRTMSTLGNTC